MSSTYLVTGAAGFIGSHLTEQLLQEGHRVVAIDNFNDYYDTRRKRANISGFKEHRDLKLFEVDICDAEAIKAICRETRPVAIAHLGAYGGVRYSIGRTPLYARVNIVGSINLLEAARANEVPLFVFASTSSVYGHTEVIPFVETDPCNHPLAPYPASKKAIEVLGHTYHNLHGMNFTALRFFSVYGPRARPDMMPFMVTDRIVRSQGITLYDGGKMKRDWSYVGDIVAGIKAALQRPLGYEVVNLGRGEPVLMSDFVDIIEGLIGKRALVQTPPAPASEPKITSADITKARTRLNYDPRTTVTEGLAKLWDWYQRELM